MNIVTTHPADECTNCAAIHRTLQRVTTETAGRIEGAACIGFAAFPNEDGHKH